MKQQHWKQGNQHIHIKSIHMLFASQLDSQNANMPNANETLMSKCQTPMKDNETTETNKTNQKHKTTQKTQNTKIFQVMKHHEKSTLDPPSTLPRPSLDPPSTPFGPRLLPTRSQTQDPTKLTPF